MDLVDKTRSAMHLGNPLDTHNGRPIHMVAKRANESEAKRWWACKTTGTPLQIKLLVRGIFADGTHDLQDDRANKSKYKAKTLVIPYPGDDTWFWHSAKPAGAFIEERSFHCGMTKV